MSQATALFTLANAAATSSSIPATQTKMETNTPRHQAVMCPLVLNSKSVCWIQNDALLVIRNVIENEVNKRLSRMALARVMVPVPAVLPVPIIPAVLPVSVIPAVLPVPVPAVSPAPLPMAPPADRIPATQIARPATHIARPANSGYGKRLTKPAPPSMSEPGAIEAYIAASRLN
jgi:hypothetical protein